MTFFDAVAVPLAPLLIAILMAILAATLILPRGWLVLYAAFVLAAVAVYADLDSRHDDAVFSGMFSVLFGLLALAALAAGLVTRWALKRPRAD